GAEMRRDAQRTRRTDFKRPQGEQCRGKRPRMREERGRRERFSSAFSPRRPGVYVPLSSSRFLSVPLRSLRSLRPSAPSRKKPGLSSRGVDLNLVAKSTEATSEAAGESCLVTSVEIGGPQIVVLEPRLEHVIYGSEDRCGHGQDRLFRSATALDADKLRAKVGILRTRGGPCSLDEGCFQPAPAARSGRQGITCTLVQPRRQSRPRKQMTGGREATHVVSDLGNDDPGDPFTHARDRDQELDGGTKGLDRLADTILDLAHSLLQCVPLGKVQLDHETVMACDPTMQGSEELCPGSLQSFRQVGQPSGVPFAPHRGL